LPGPKNVGPPLDYLLSPQVGLGELRLAGKTFAHCFRPASASSALSSRFALASAGFACWPDFTSRIGAGLDCLGAMSFYTVLIFFPLPAGGWGQLPAGEFVQEKAFFPDVVFIETRFSFFSPVE